MASSADDEKNLSFLDHLEELRSRLIRSVVALSIGVIIGWFLSPLALDLLTEPVTRAYQRAATESARQVIRLELLPDSTIKLANPEILDNLKGSYTIELYRKGEQKPAHVFLTDSTKPMIYLRPMDPFLIRMKAAVVIGVILALPIILLQAWAFIAPGLLPSERRLALPLIVAGSILFPVGASFAYFVLDVTLLFLAQFAAGDAAMQNDAQAYLSFALTMMLAFGAVFELPLVVVLATRVGIVTTTWLAERRAYIFVFQLILSAVVTPSGDPLTLLAMALPLQILFEIALVASRVLDRMSDRDKQEAPARNPEASGH